MNRLRIIILILSFLLLSGNFNICLGQDVRVQIEERLMRLKQRLLHEQEALYSLNEKLQREIQQLLEQNSQLQVALKQAKQDYSLLSQELAALRQDKQLLQAEYQQAVDKLQEKEAEIASLEEKLANSQGLLEQNSQLQVALKQVRQEYAEATKEVRLLKKARQSLPKEKMVYKPDPTPAQTKQIEQLKQELAEVEKLLQQKIQQLKQQRVQQSAEKLSGIEDKKGFNLMKITCNVDEWIKVNLW